MQYNNLIILFLVYIQSSHQAKFGEICIPSYICNDGSQCLGTTCGCPEGQDFFEELGQCAIKVGSTCDVNMDYYCVQGSKCDQESSTCQCKAPSKALSNGACSPLFQEICSASQPCTSGQFLDCVDGRCSCSSTFSMIMDYNTDSQTYQCKAVSPGGKCSTNGITWPICTINSECINGVCQCMKGYGPSTNGPCMKMYLEPCDVKAYECNPRSGLVCKNGSCQCSDKSLIWDQEVGSCVAQLGNECLAGSGPIICSDPNASCQYPKKNLSQRPICKCNSGYMEDSFRCNPDPAQPNCQCSQNNSPFSFTAIPTPPGY